MTLFLVVSQGGPPGSVDDIIDPAPPVRCLNYRASYVQVIPRSGHGTHGRVGLARQDRAGYAVRDARGQLGDHSRRHRPLPLLEMTVTSRTQVGIVGAGPAGLLL